MAISKHASRTSEVNDFMEKLDHPLKAEIQAIRDVVKGVNQGVTEQIKWSAPSFSYSDKGYIATFNLRDTKRVHLIFHNDSIAQVKSAILEGDYKDRRMTHFSDMSDVKSKRQALEAAVKDLIELMDK